MIILMDCDGVLGDFVQGVVDALNTESINATYDAASVTCLDIDVALGVPRKAIDQLVGREGFCNSLEPLPGAREALDYLRDHQYELYCVTSPWRSPYWAGERLLWLERLMGFDKKHIIQCSAKELVWGDVLVDDKPETIRTWCHYHGRGTGVLMDAPWNRQYPPSSMPVNAERCRNWNQLFRIIDGL